MHGVLPVNVNALLDLEKCAALNKWFDFIKPLIPISPIERIKTDTSESIYPHLLCCLFDDGNGYEYKLVMINNVLVDIPHLYLTSKGL